MGAIRLEQKLVLLVLGRNVCLLNSFQNCGVETPIAYVTINSKGFREIQFGRTVKGIRMICLWKFKQFSGWGTGNLRSSQEIRRDIDGF